MKLVKRDPRFEEGFATHLRKMYSSNELLSLYGDFQADASPFGASLRRILMKAMCKVFGDACVIEPGVQVQHPETFEIGDVVHLGRGAFLHGWYRGRLRTGHHVWVGPGSYLHCSDLTIGDYVGIGPGVKILGTQHTGKPRTIPILKTRLVTNPIRIGSGADIGTGATILPGVSIGKNATIGAGAVVTSDVPSYGVAVGVPAKTIKKRR